MFEAPKTLGSKIQVEIAGTFTDVPGVQNFTPDPGEEGTFDAGDLTSTYDKLKPTCVGSGGSVTSNVAGMIGGKLLRGAKMATMAIAAIVIAGAGWGVTLAADAEQAEIAFTTMLKSGDQAKAVLAGLEQFAASTPFQLNDLRDGAKQLLNAGIATTDLQGRLTMLGDIAAGTGKPINDFVRIFAKVKSTGKVSLETLNQLAERGVPIYDALATQLGKSRTEMLSMISNPRGSSRPFGRTDWKSGCEPHARDRRCRR